MSRHFWQVDTFFTAKEADVFGEFRTFCLKIQKVSPRSPSPCTLLPKAPLAHEHVLMQSSCRFQVEIMSSRRKCTTLEQLVQAHEGTEIGNTIKDFVIHPSSLPLFSTPLRTPLLIATDDLAPNRSPSLKRSRPSVGS